jgi:hypothetical protein
MVKVNLQSLKFFKIHERGLLPDNKTWATDEMGQKANSTQATIPHDIKPGKYIVRHELIAMHFATEDSVWTRAGADSVVGPQVGDSLFSSCLQLLNDANVILVALHPMLQPRRYWHRHLYTSRYTLSRNLQTLPPRARSLL